MLRRFNHWVNRSICLYWHAGIQQSICPLQLGVGRVQFLLCDSKVLGWSERFGLTLVLFSLMNPFRFYRWHVFDSVCSLRWAVKKKAALPVLVEARPHSVKATGQLLEGSGPESVWSSVGAKQQ